MRVQYFEKKRQGSIVQLAGHFNKQEVAELLKEGYRKSYRKRKVTTNKHGIEVLQP